VELLTCPEDKPIPADSISGVLQFLAAHQIKAEHRAFGLSGLRIGEALQKVAADGGAGLLVMGAYGHTRLREFILGGATASALRYPKLPILMSH
jgi:nucleotide-binding universal stress UspA family protein